MGNGGDTLFLNSCLNGMGGRGDSGRRWRRREGGVVGLGRGGRGQGGGRCGAADRSARGEKVGEQIEQRSMVATFVSVTYFCCEKIKIEMPHLATLIPICCTKYIIAPLFFFLIEFS